MSSRSTPGPDRPAMTSTVDLIHRAREGDRQAYELLASRFLLPLQRWAKGRLPVRARRMIETDDLVQDTLLRTMQRLDQLEPKRVGGFQSYLRQAIINGIRDELRRVEVRPQVGEPAEDLASDDASPLEELLTREKIQNYEAALNRLRPEEREAVLARLEMGFKYAQIAEVLGKPSADAARMAVSRAMLQLAEEMSHDE